MSMEQEQSKAYDAQLYWNLTRRCNLDCNFCSPTFSDKKTARISNIKIPLLMASLERTNRVFRIHFTGESGEPFLVPNLVEACVEITKKHYISIDTNLTCAQVKEFSEKISPRKVVKIVASAHIVELERCGLLDTFMNNLYLLKGRGFDVMTVEVAHPSLYEQADRYRQFFEKAGFELRFIPFVGEYDKKIYPRSYKDDELKKFGFKGRESLIRKHYQHKKVCNAGYNVGIIDSEGNISPCNRIKNRIGNIYNQIEFKKTMIICPSEFCEYSFNISPLLFEKALNECKASPQRLRFYRFYPASVCAEIDKVLGLCGIFLRRNCQTLYLLLRWIKG